MKGLIIALQFMTRIPLFIEVEINDKEFGRSSKFFPLVGLIIGLLLALTYLLAISFLPLPVVGALIIIMEALITGGLHFDGFIDTMDGLFSARPREQMFEIMQDSRVGAYGMASFFCLLLLKFAILISLPFADMFYILLLMPMLGRWLMLSTLAFFPYAKEQGLGKVFQEETDVFDWLLISVIILLLTFITLPGYYIYLYLLTFCLVLTPIILINKQLGGHTGDTYGAINEIAEVAFLLVCLIVL